MTLLHEVNKDVDDRAFCGPTAISAVTGVPISKIRRKVQRIRGRNRAGRRRSIKGMHNSELRTAMKRLGWRVAERASAVKHHGWGMSLQSWCEDRAHLPGPFIVVSGHHYVAISGGMICDTFSGGKPVPWRESVWSLRTIVTTWYRFKGKTRMPPDEKPKPEKPKVDHVGVRYAKAQAALARLETRAKRIATAIKKRRRQVLYYERKLASCRKHTPRQIPPEPSSIPAVAP